MVFCLSWSYMMPSTYVEPKMPGQEVKIRRITCETYHDVDTTLEDAIRSELVDDWHPVSCFPKPQLNLGTRKDQPAMAERGADNPYSSIWRQPTGPTFIAAFTRASTG